MIEAGVLLFCGWLLIDSSQNQTDDFFRWVYCITGVVSLLTGLLFLAEGLV